MSLTLQAYVFAIAVGAWLIGMAMGIILGVRLPRRMMAWREAGGFAVMGALAIGITVILLTIYGPGRQ